MDKGQNLTFKEVYLAVKQIPAGFVTTYGDIAKILQTNSRTVGWALHANKSDKVPCHRVVNREGKLAANFAFDGWKEQRRRLLAEGITFRDEMHVDMGKHFYKMTK